MSGAAVDAASGAPRRGEPRPKAAATNQQLRQQAVDRMIEAAIALIAVKGAAGLTLVDVGRAAGYSHTLPNYYFKSKNELLRQAYGRSVGAFRRRSGAWRRQALRAPVRDDALFSTMLAYVHGGCADPAGARAVNLIAAEAVTSLPGLLPEVRLQNERMLALLQDRIEAGACGTGAAEAPASIEALLVLAALRGLVSQHLLGVPAADVDAAVRMLHGFIEGGPAGGRSAA
ncbi:TetR/AcrR family transcriptional regulator [Verticiella sediminum]|uniref:TetR/AcrR family transcriptional regulator n=1 Tax=Verticiella sediminum TaxID=1247510 RepID=A0A556B239_9BURK|nr:TetR/AcrR family transcriptional regulator [Verticiella sediminum]TSH99239.1 TetR/AcrR family transcriptional regulator [Verticiella sediminum]